MERDVGVLYSGWLIKSPPERKLRRPFAWRRRWFVLRREELLYFRSDRARKPIRTIPLSDCLQIDSGLAFSKDGAKGSFVFDVRTEARTFYLVAESEEDMGGWVRALCSLCGFNETAQGNESEPGNHVGQTDTGAQAPSSQPPQPAEGAPISLQPVAAQPEATPPPHRPMGEGRVNGHRLGNEEPNGYLCLYNCESRIPDNLQSAAPDQLYSVPRPYKLAATSPSGTTQEVTPSLPSPTQEVTSQPEETSSPPSLSDPDQEATSPSKTGNSQEVKSSELSLQCYTIPPPPCQVDENGRGDVQTCGTVPPASVSRSSSITPQVASSFCGKFWNNSESCDSKDPAEEQVGFECYDVPRSWDSPKPGPKNRQDLSPPENYVAMETSSRSPSRSVTMETCGRSVATDNSGRSSSRSVTMEPGGQSVAAEFGGRAHSRSVTTEIGGRWSPLTAGFSSVFGPTAAASAKPGTEAAGPDGAGGGPGERRAGAKRASSVGTRGAALGGVVPPPAHMGFRGNPGTVEGGSPRAPRAHPSPRTPRTPRALQSPRSPASPRTPQTPQEGPPVNRELKPNRSGRRPPPLALQSGIAANGDLPPPEPSPITKTFTRPGPLRLSGPSQPRPPSIHSSASSSDSHDDEEDESYVAMQPKEHDLQYLDLDLGRSDTAPSTQASSRALEDRVHYVELDDRRTRALQDTQKAWSHSRAPGPTGNPGP